MTLTSALNNLTISKKPRCIACVRRAENALRDAHSHAYVLTFPLGFL